MKKALKHLAIGMLTLAMSFSLCCGTCRHRRHVFHGDVRRNGKRHARRQQLGWPVDFGGADW